VHIGPSDYVAWLDDRKWACVRLEGRAFGDGPLSLEYKLEVWDSPNSAGVIIDAGCSGRCARRQPVIRSPAGRLADTVPGNRASEEVVPVTAPKTWALPSGSTVGR
jgi:myo-inositol-1-phosphate synthase